MPYPMDVTQVTVTGRFDPAVPGATVARGAVDFWANVILVDAGTGDIIEPTILTVTLDATGAFSVQLMATDDPDLTPGGWAYWVRERIDGYPPRQYLLPFPAGGPYALGYRAPLVAAPALNAFVPYALLAAPNGVATLDAGRQVPLSQLGNAPTGAGVPSNTVTDGRAFGQAPNAGGADPTYARGAHAHGTPPAPTAAGVGAPALSVLTTKGDLYVASGAGVVVRLAVGADGTVPIADSSQAGGLRYGTVGGGSLGVKLVDSGPITTGDIPVAAGGFVQLGPDMVIAAAAGDWLELSPEALAGSSGPDMQFEAATRVSGADHTYWSSGTGASLWAGARPPWYVSSGLFASPGPVHYKVLAGDLVTGQVTVRFYGRVGSASRTVDANANFPLRLILKNVGQGT